MKKGFVMNCTQLDYVNKYSCFVFPVENYHSGIKYTVIGLMFLLQIWDVIFKTNIMNTYSSAVCRKCDK